MFLRRSLKQGLCLVVFESMLNKRIVTGFGREKDLAYCKTYEDVGNFFLILNPEKKNTEKMWILSLNFRTDEMAGFNILKNIFNNNTLMLNNHKP